MNACEGDDDMNYMKYLEERHVEDLAEGGQRPGYITPLQALPPTPSTKTEWIMRKAIQLFKHKNVRYRANSSDEFVAFKQSSLVRNGVLSPVGQAVAWASKQWDTAVRLVTMEPSCPIPVELLKEKLTDTMIYCAIALAMLEESATENLKKEKRDEQL